MKSVSWTQIEKLAKRLEKKILNERGKSWCFSTIQTAVNPFIQCDYMGENRVDIEDGWKDAMKKKAMEIIK